MQFQTFQRQGVELFTLARTSESNSARTAADGRACVSPEVVGDGVVLLDFIMTSRVDNSPASSSYPQVYSIQNCSKTQLSCSLVD